MMTKKVTACLNFGPNWQSLAVLKNGQTPIQLLTLIMDSGWSKSQIAPKIGLKILEFYGATYLLQEFWATINFFEWIFFCFLRHCAKKRCKKDAKKTQKGRTCKKDLKKRRNTKNLYVSLEISYLCQFSTSFNNLTRKNNAKNNHSLLESFTEKLIHALAHLMALHSNIFMLNSWFDISPNKWHQKWRHKKLRSIVKKAQMTTSLYQSVYFWQLGCRDFISYCFALAKFKLNSLNLIFSRVFLHW